MAPNGVVGVRGEQRGCDALVRYADPKVFSMETWGALFPRDGSDVVSHQAPCPAPSPSLSSSGGGQCPGVL